MGEWLRYIIDINTRNGYHIVQWYSLQAMYEGFNREVLNRSHPCMHEVH